MPLSIEALASRHSRLVVISALVFDFCGTAGWTGERAGRSVGLSLAQLIGFFTGLVA